MILVKHNQTGKYYSSLLSARRELGISGGVIRGKVKSKEITYESVEDNLIGKEVIISGVSYKNTNEQIY